MSADQQEPSKADRVIERLAMQLANAQANVNVLAVELEDAQEDRARLAAEVQRLASELESMTSARDALIDGEPDAEAG
jgi:FtsZ-binding cell division protein ZapB